MVRDPIFHCPVPTPASTPSCFYPGESVKDLFYYVSYESFWFLFINLGIQFLPKLGSGSRSA